MGWNQQRLQMETNQPFLTHMTFRQIHRSYIVNMKHASSVERTSITLDNGYGIFTGISKVTTNVKVQKGSSPF